MALEWMEEAHPGSTEAIVLTLKRDGRYVGMVTVDFVNRAFALGWVGVPIRRNESGVVFEGRGWKPRLLQAAKNALVEAAEA